MAVTLREQQIIDLYDQGLSHREIAVKMGIKRDSVRRVITMLTYNLGIDRQHHSKMACGSTDLKQALIRAGGHR